MSNQAPNFKQLVSNLNDQQLSELRDEVNGTVEDRRKKFDIERIRQGMSEDDRAEASGEILRALKEAGY